MSSSTFLETVDPYDLDTPELAAALLAGAATAPLPFHAAVELIVEHGTWLNREELLGAVRAVRTGDRVVAAIDWGVIDLDDWYDQGEYQILLLAQLLAGVKTAWRIECLLDDLTDLEWELAAGALSTVGESWSRRFLIEEYDQ